MTLDTQTALVYGCLEYFTASLLGNLPIVGCNDSNSILDADGELWGPLQVGLGPGPGPSACFSIVRFTSPSNSLYQVKGLFSGLDYWGGTSTFVHILTNGSSIFDGDVEGFGATQSFNLTVRLNVGDNVDFAVGMGQRQGIGWDTTGLYATILTLPTAPVFTLQPQGTVGYWGASVEFDAEAFANPPPSYLWFKDGFPIGWATDSSLVLQDLQLTDGGNYWVVASNSQGSVTSNPALLIVNPAGVSIGLHPFLTVNGTVGKSFGVQYTTNVSDTNSWITLTNFTLTQPSIEWIDTNANAAPGNAPRFYRVIAIP